MAAIKPSPTLTISARANAMKQAGVDVVNFGVGEPDFPTPAPICEAAIKAIHAGQTRYTPSAGTNELRDAICHKLKRDNQLEYARGNILVTNGGKQGLFNLAVALFQEGDEVIVPAPFWVSYPEQIRLVGATPVIVSTTMHNGFCMTPDALAKAMTPRTKAVILNSPSNPTGGAYSADQLRALGEVCLKHKIWIIADEIYEHISYNGFKPVSIASLSSELKACTIISNGASKAYAMTGWRLGFVAAPTEIISALVMLQDQSTSNVCSITQAAGIAAFHLDLAQIAPMCAEFDARRRYIVAALNALPDVQCFDPLGAFYVFPHIAAVFGRQTQSGQVIADSLAFCEYLLDQYHVAAVPGSAFGAEGHIRLSFATSLDVIKKGIERLGVAIQNLR